MRRIKVGKICLQTRAHEDLEPGVHLPNSCCSCFQGQLMSDFLLSLPLFFFLLFFTPSYSHWLLTTLYLFMTGTPTTPWPSPVSPAEMPVASLHTVPLRFWGERASCFIVSTLGCVYYCLMIGFKLYETTMEEVCLHSELCQGTCLVQY